MAKKETKLREVLQNFHRASIDGAPEYVRVTIFATNRPISRVLKKIPRGDSVKRCVVRFETDGVFFDCVRIRFAELLKSVSNKGVCEDVSGAMRKIKFFEEMPVNF